MNEILGLIGTVLSVGIVQWFFTRKASKRKAEAEADMMELDVEKARIKELREDLDIERERNSELAKQNIDKENRFIEQTKRLRECQDRELEAQRLAILQAKEIGELKAERAEHRCVNEACAFREPENAHSRRAKLELKSKPKKGALPKKKPTNQPKENDNKADSAN